MAPDTDFTLGEHNAAIRQLLDDQRQMRDDLAGIHSILAERRGERRAALWFVSVVSAVLGAVLTFAGNSLAGMFARGHA